MVDLVRCHQEKFYFMKELDIPFFLFVKVRYTQALHMKHRIRFSASATCQDHLTYRHVCTVLIFSLLDTAKFTHTGYCNMNHVICSFTCQVQSAYHKTTLIWYTLSTQDPVSRYYCRHLLRTVIQNYDSYSLQYDLVVGFFLASQHLRG